MKNRKPLQPLVLLTLFAASISNPLRAATNDNIQEATKNEKAVEIVDAPIDPFRVELLDLAYDAVSRFPLNPHIKNRSRAQEQVAVTALELDQPRRAIRYFEGIENWRRAVGFADYAIYCAKMGNPSEAKQYLDIAEAAVDSEEIQTEQTWRRDRIRARVAVAHRELGDDQAAARFEANLSETEQDTRFVSTISRLDESDFDFQIAAIEEIAKVGEFEKVRNSLTLCVALYEQFYEDEARRNKAIETLRGAWGPVPLSVRIDVLLDLARIDLDREKTEPALAKVNEARTLFDSSTWTLEFHVPLVAGIAKMRYLAGNEKKAIAEAQAVISLFEKQKRTIASIDHAEALVPLAETFYVMGKRQTALVLYGWALDSTERNPNARPRADDLLLVCCSMAKRGVEPTAPVWERLRERRDGLVAPW